MKLNGLTAQVNETGRFRITAKDFFEVNNQLIPSVRTSIHVGLHKFNLINFLRNNCKQLMGTTLTYFIILYQMDSVGQ